MKSKEIQAPTPDLNTEYLRQLPRGRYQDRMFLRRPGFDFGTIAWPLSFALVHMLVQVAVFFVIAFVRAISQGVGFGEASIDALIHDGFTDVLSATVYSAVLIIIYCSFIRRQGRREPRYLLKQTPSPLDMVASLVAIIGALGIATLLFSGIELLSEHNAWFAKILEEYKSLSESLVSNQHVFLSILSTVILVPIAEELLFRGIIFSELKRAMPASVAIVLCAFLFALFHFNYVQSSYVFFAGLIITMIYYWTASIGIAIFMHIAYNFFGGGLSLFIADESLVNTILFWAELICVPLLFVALAIVFLRHRFDPPRSSRRLAFPFQGDATFFENEAQIINSKSGSGSFEELVDARIEGSDESRYKRFHF